MQMPSAGVARRRESETFPRHLPLNDFDYFMTKISVDSQWLTFTFFIGGPIHLEIAGESRSFSPSEKLLRLAVWFTFNRPQTRSNYKWLITYFWKKRINQPSADLPSRLSENVFISIKRPVSLLAVHPFTDPFSDQRTASECQWNCGREKMKFLRQDSAFSQISKWSWTIFHPPR